MPQPTIVAEIHEPLDVHRHVAAQITLHDVVAVDGLTDLDDFRVSQFVDATLDRNPDLRANVFGELVADPMDVLKRDHHALVRRDIDASNTSHVRSPLVSRA